MQMPPRSTAPNNLKLKTRRSRRSRARIMGTVRYLTKEVVGRIVDISPSGVALDLQTPIAAAPGSKVAVECEDIGSIEGTVRWFRNSRIGIEFNRSSNSSAKVDSYFRFFHKEIKPVLKG